MSAKRHKSSHSTDAVKLALMLSELRLPAMKQMWSGFAETRRYRRLAGCLGCCRPWLNSNWPNVTGGALNATSKKPGWCPVKRSPASTSLWCRSSPKSKVMALAAGDVWLNNGHNLLMFGPPGTGKRHLSSAIGLALVENGYRVLFTRTTDLVQRLQRARRELTLEILLARLDRYHLLILDDFAYVSKDQAETSVLFELISVRYERPFHSDYRQSADLTNGTKCSQTRALRWRPVDRLVHHATILEMNVESYRRRHAVQQARNKPARSSKRATAKKAQPKSVQD